MSLVTVDRRAVQRCYSITYCDPVHVSIRKDKRDYFFIWMSLTKNQVGL